MKPNISLTLGLMAGNKGVCLFIRRVSSALCSFRYIDTPLTHLFIHPPVMLGFISFSPIRLQSFTL
jgi:hypothetical protein